MSMTRDAGDITFQCDYCHDDIETETSNFDRAREALLQAGWSPFKYLGEWLHFCTSTCRRNYLEERKRP